MFLIISAISHTETSKPAVNTHLYTPSSQLSHCQFYHREDVNQLELRFVLLTGSVKRSHASVQPGNSGDHLAEITEGCGCTGKLP